MLNIRIIITLAIAIAITGCTHGTTSSFYNTNNQIAELALEPTTTQDVVIEEERVIAEDEVEIIKEADEEEKELPKTYDQEVAFASQAPFANWDEIHKEACEEAAMIITARHFKNQSLNEQIMDEEIHKLTEWEEKNGYKIDLTANEAAEIIRKYFNLSAAVVADVSEDYIKKYLSEGKLIIIPAAGRLLGNPNFQTPGPIYHMLVIRGYDRNEFITNDPGTKRGDGFKYKYNTLINAIHDWDHKLAEEGMEESEMNSGRKVIIVVSD